MDVSNVAHQLQNLKSSSLKQRAQFERSRQFIGHHHLTPATPFTVGVVELVGGPVLKAIVEGEAVAVGDSVTGVLVDGEDHEGNPIVDLHFRVVT